jgi:hypothetical protein
LQQQQQLRAQQDLERQRIQHEQELEHQQWARQQVDAARKQELERLHQQQTQQLLQRQIQAQQQLAAKLEEQRRAVKPGQTRKPWQPTAFYSAMRQGTSLSNARQLSNPVCCLKGDCRRRRFVCQANDGASQLRRIAGLLTISRIKTCAQLSAPIIVVSRKSG